MMKPGDEQWALLPQNGYTGITGQTGADGTNVAAGTYYAVVVSQGQNLTNNTCYGPGSGWGAGSASYTLSSGTDLTALPNTLSYGNDLLFTNAQAGGESKFYQFTVPAGMASIQVSLQNVVGNPQMTLNYGANLVAPGYVVYTYYLVDAYGNYGGTTPSRALTACLFMVPVFRAITRMPAMSCWFMPCRQRRCLLMEAPHR
jgi:hypothetical protein